MTSTDLRATVDASVTQYRARFLEQRLALEASLAQDLPAVAHDPNAISQVVLNLLDNAAKYASSGGCAQITLSGDADWVELGIVDFGGGIPAAERARLRQAFQRGQMSQAAAGSGLGLAQVDPIATAHHGHFIIDAPDDHAGVKAVVTFPSYKPQP